VVLILDIRQGLTPLDRQMVEALATYERKWVAVLSKADKLGTQERNGALTALRGELASLGARGVLPYSSLKSDGRHDLWKILAEAATLKT
jgi:GTP-binding protein